MFATFMLFVMDFVFALVIGARQDQVPFSDKEVLGGDNTKLEIQNLYCCMEEQGLWSFFSLLFVNFHCLLIREILLHLVTRLWDTYLAEGDSLPEFLVYVSQF
ncbi:hypothetical protein HPP92_012714 [Vanilla planifolia]|uniref:Rab-GAP TBC domain-containing protein n=1 Tax=Vanilla planifolia TaxID=51239 RepID=A0A835QQC0_VANPL|nr:hypothetical protein HPP92_012714 [Vanilla planifolia]